MRQPFFNFAFQDFHRTNILFSLALNILNQRLHSVAESRKNSFENKIPAKRKSPTNTLPFELSMGILSGKFIASLVFLQVLEVQEQVFLFPLN